MHLQDFFHLGNSVNVTKFVTDEIFTLDVYSKTPGRTIKLQIGTVNKTYCQTKSFTTGSQGHIRIGSFDDDTLGQCFRYLIQDKTATLRLINDYAGKTIIGKMLITFVYQYYIKLLRV